MSPYSPYGYPSYPPQPQPQMQYPSQPQMQYQPQPQYYSPYGQGGYGQPSYPGYSNSPSWSEPSMPADSGFTQIAAVSRQLRGCFSHTQIYKYVFL